MSMVHKTSDKVLCPKCHGSGVNKLPNGIATCDRCAGWCEVHRDYLTVEERAVVEARESGGANG